MPAMDTPLFERLKRIRKAAKKSQTALAHELGYKAHSEVSQIERGRQVPHSLEIIERWAEACGYRIALLPEASAEDGVVTAAMAELTDEQRQTVLRLAQALPHLPEPIRAGLENDLRFWEESYVPRVARPRANTN